ncbi:MAG TPA: hypothetical protein VMM81_08360, partial [Acidimicrobiia bacterium]|nr:hypothetical protein [Acidimicrobiia bacterium]
PTAQQRPLAPPQGPSAREGVLARRRMALLGLGVAVPVTLILAIITGSIPVLIANILISVALAGYVAMLLSIKQSQQRPAAPQRRPATPQRPATQQRRPARDEDDDMRPVPRERG